MAHPGQLSTIPAAYCVILLILLAHQSQGTWVEELPDLPGADCSPSHHDTQTGSPQCDSKEGTLELVQVVFRHGERTPLMFYPNDPWRHMINWPLGLGQLTPEGRKRIVCLGNWLKVAYGKFFCEKFNSSVISIRSSNTDRTYQSAELLMMGMYPPVGGITEEMMDRVPLNSFPIETVPCDQDMLLRHDVFCPAAIAEEKRVRSSDNRLRIAIAENEKAWRCMVAHSGMSPKQMDLFKMSGVLYDTLTVEKRENMCLPEWTKSVYPRPLQHLAGLQMFIPSMTPRLARFRAGVLLSKLFGNMYNKVGWEHAEKPDRNSKSRRLQVYAAHDTTLATLLGALGYKRTHVPSPGAAIVFELRRKWDGTKHPYYMKIYYKRGDIVENIVIEDCGCLCKLTDANTLVSHLQITPKQWRSDCEECSDDADCERAKNDA